MDIEPATFQNAVCSISQNLLLIHPIGPKRIAITHPWRPKTLLDTRTRIFNNPNKEDNRDDTDESETETLIIPIDRAGPDERRDGGNGDGTDGDCGNGDDGNGDSGNEDSGNEDGGTDGGVVADTIELDFYIIKPARVLS
jgi:hypothetical protein